MPKKNDKNPQPMDDGIREEATGAPSANTQRVCWAIKTLVAEVHSLFPEVPVEYSNYDGRNTALDVMFDLTELDEAGRTDLANLVEMAVSDERVAHVHIQQEVSVLVSMHPRPRTQDSREPFGLPDAYLILAGEDEGYDIEDDAIVGASFYGGGDGSQMYGGSL